jgi:hypothetical protein
LTPSALSGNLNHRRRDETVPTTRRTGSHQQY